VILCLVCGAPAVADDDCTKFFVPGVTSGNISWHVDENWIPIGVPVPTDVACILEDGGYQVTVTEPVTVAGLQLDIADGNAMLKIVATDFTLNGSAIATGDTKLKVNDGAVLRSDSGGVLDVHSKLVIEGGTVEVDVELYGHLNWWGIGSITGALETYPGSTIEVEGPLADAHLTVVNGFDNNGDLVFNHTVDQSLTVISGSLVNTASGTISTRMTTGDADNAPELRADLVNHGLIDVTSLDLRLVRDGSQHINGADGIIQVAAAELVIDLGGLTDVPSNFTNYGTVIVADGGTMRMIGSVGPLDVVSNFTNYGTATVAGGGLMRIVGAPGGGSPISVFNVGLIEIEADGTFALTDAVFDSSSTGQISGSGLLDLTQADAFVFNGTLSPGLSPGILTIDGQIQEGPDAVIMIEVGGQSPGMNLDRLDVTGDLGADGALEVTLLGPYHPAGGESFQVLTFDHLNGWFAKVNLPQLMHLLTWDVNLGEHELVLEVSCEGTQLGIGVAADRNPVSIGHEFIYQTWVMNHSLVEATNIVVIDTLPPELMYRSDLSSPECVLVGSTVECSRASLAPMASWELFIAVEAVVAGSIDNTVWVGAWECDTDATDDQATASVETVAAEPCDANYDLAIDSDDLVPAVGHIFGEIADGNPDCRLANGITADDLAAIIEAGQ